MSVTWRPMTDEKTGAPMAGEHVGAIRGEPSFRLEANRYSWGVFINGTEARRAVIQDSDLDRASRRRGGEVDALTLGKERAEAWAEKVVKKRDEGGTDALP